MDVIVINKNFQTSKLYFMHFEMSNLFYTHKKKEREREKFNEDKQLDYWPELREEVMHRCSIQKKKSS